jgi:hypothetical protein
MTNSPTKLRPLLSYFEEVIPEQVTAKAIEYDETRMILLADGEPALYEPGLVLSGSTKMTRVAQETVDDD